MMQDLPQLIRDSFGNVEQINFTSEDMRIWDENNIIPKDLMDSFNERLTWSLNIHQKLTAFRVICGDESMKQLDMPKILTKEETDKVFYEAKMQIELYHFLILHWDTLLACILNNKKKTLYKGVQPDRNFGVARIEADCVYYIRDLLDSMEARYQGDNDYIARGEVKNSRGLSIALEFEFKAKDQQEANKRVDDYRKKMITRGLKIFLAYWKIANKKGGLNFECSISEVMAEMASENRSTYFNDKERAEFWKITKMLAATKIKMEWIAKPNKGRPRQGREKTSIEWVEQPMLQIYGGEKKLQDECPIRIFVTVLTKESAERRFVRALIANQTLKLHPSDVHLAFIIQLRAAQMENGKKELCFDWDFTFKLANVEGKAKVNPSAAKTLIRKKMNTYKEYEILNEWQEDKDQVRIMPQKS